MIVTILETSHYKTMSVFMDIPGSIMDVGSLFDRPSAYGVQERGSVHGTNRVRLRERSVSEVVPYRKRGTD